MPRKKSQVGNSQRPPATQTPREDVFNRAPLTEAERAEMEADPLPVELPGGEGVDTSGTRPDYLQEATSVVAAQDQAYPVIKDHPVASAILAAGLLVPAPKPAFMQGILKCHTCGRTGDDDLGECPNRQLPNFTCPEPGPIDPDKDVVLYSGILGVTRTIPIASLVKGHAKNYLPACHQDDCGYKVLHPKSQG